MNRVSSAARGISRNIGSFCSDDLMSALDHEVEAADVSEGMSTGPWHSTIEEPRIDRHREWTQSRDGADVRGRESCNARLFATSNLRELAAIWASVGSFLVIRANVPDRRCGRRDG